MKIAKWDLVPTSANLLPAFESFDALAQACAEFCDRVNNRVHKETGKTPAARLAVERDKLHRVPHTPFALATGEARLVDDGQTVRFGSVRYSTPPGHVGTYAFCRVVGEELVITADTPAGSAEIARHRLSTPGNPRIADEHYPNHPEAGSPRPDPGRAPRRRSRSCRSGRCRAAGWPTRPQPGPPGSGPRWATPWNWPRCSAPKSRHRAGLAAEAGRFADGDLASIADHIAAVGALGEVTRADEAHSVQPGTTGWAGRPMTEETDTVIVDRAEMVFIRDLLELTDKYLRNRWRDPALAPGPGIALAADGRPMPHPPPRARKTRWPPPPPRPSPPSSTACCAGCACPTCARPHRRPGHRPRPALGPRRGPPSPDQRGSHRPGRRDPQNAPEHRGLPHRQDLGLLAARGVLHPRGHPELAHDPGMDRPGREPGGRRTLRHRKSHFAEALAHAAIEKDLRVAWFTLETLTAAIAKAKIDGSTARTVARICRCDLVVVDDIGMLPAGRRPPRRSIGSSTPPTNARSIAVTGTSTQPGSTRSCPKPSPRPPWTGCCTTPTSSSPRATRTGSPKPWPARG